MEMIGKVKRMKLRTRGTAERRMFGGVCFTLNGNMACGVVSTDIMVRVGPDGYDDALKLPHARVMDFTGRPMKGYVFISAAGTRSDSSLRRWIDSGVAHVQALPPKPGKGKRA